jgi:hypothetical protein
MGLYGLPFDGIKGIRAEVVRLDGVEKIHLAEFCILKQEFDTAFGYGLPIRLIRVTNNSYSPFGWRDMSGGYTSRTIAKGGLSGELGRAVLDKLPREKQHQLLDIEYRRIHLCHALGLVQYELARLKRLESEFDAWRKLMRAMKQH